jgi:hypothetical protein
VLDLLVEELGSTAAALCERDALDLLLAALDRDNLALAQSVYRAMKAATPGGSAASVDAAAPHWPAASVDTSAALVVGLARALQTREAIEIINTLRSRGLPTAEDVGFGSLVACPADPQRPLAVVQPQEGVKPAADAVTRCAQHCAGPGRPAPGLRDCPWAPCYLTYLLSPGCCPAPKH